LGKREERLEILGGENKENKKQDQENSDGYEVHMLLRQRTIKGTWTYANARTETGR
jgi:hypothetical protein